MSLSKSRRKLQIELNHPPHFERLVPGLMDSYDARRRELWRMHASWRVRLVTRPSGLLDDCAVALAVLAVRLAEHRPVYMLVHSLRCTDSGTARGHVWPCLYVYIDMIILSRSMR